MTFTKGHIPTVEMRKKMSESHQGSMLSEEHKQNISKGLKGYIPWNKGKSYSVSKNSLIALNKGRFKRWKINKSSGFKKKYYQLIYQLKTILRFW